MHRFGVPWHVAVSAAILAALALALQTYLEVQRMSRQLQYFHHANTRPLRPTSAA